MRNNKLQPQMNQFNNFESKLKSKLKVKKMIKESKIYKKKQSSSNILDEY